MRRDPLADEPGQLRVDRIFAGHYPCEEHDGYVCGITARTRVPLGETVPATPKLATDIQREVQNYASGLRFAGACRSRNHRIDGSGARAIRPPDRGFGAAVAASTRSRNSLSRFRTVFA